MSTETAKPIAEATVAELRTFAMERLGLDPDAVKAAKKPEDVVALLRAAGFEADAIIIGKPPVTPTRPSRSASSQVQFRPKGEVLVAKGGTWSKDDPRVILTIPTARREDGKPDNKPIFVSINGTAMAIPRAKMVDIPYSFYVGLQNAEQGVGEQEQPLESDVEISMVPRIPVTVHAMPSDEEIAAFNTRGEYTRAQQDQEIRLAQANQSLLLLQQG